MFLKKSLFTVALLILVASANANAQTVNVNNFNVNYLIISPTGVMNLNSVDSYGIIGSTPFPNIETYIKNGYADGAWNGIGGINSSVAAADPTGTTSLALMRGQDYLDLYGGEENPHFFGNAVTSSCSLIRYTYYGDANMDGVVDNKDLASIQWGLECGGIAAGYSGWAWGDFNYDGAIDENDMALFNYNFSSNLPALDSVSSVRAMAWRGGSSTDWASEQNWDSNPTAPQGPGTKVRFGDTESISNVVDMTSNGHTVGSIYFAASVSTTIQSSGGFSLTLDNNDLPSMINVSGSHTISAPVLLDNDATVFGPGTLELSGGISGNYALTVLGNLTATSIEVDSLIIGNAVTPQAVPEPSTIALLFIATLGCLLLRRRGP